MNDDHQRQFLSMERLWRAHCDLKADKATIREHLLDELAAARVTLNRLALLLVDLHRAQHQLDDVYDRLAIHTAADGPLIYELVSKAQTKRDVAVRALMAFEQIECDECASVAIGRPE